jgi:SAM-dependent methyltransferase
VSAALRCYRLRGGAVEQALDLLHVHADVAGVLEGEGEATVWLHDAMPDLGVAGLAVEELHDERMHAAASGLEQDRVIVVAPDLVVRPPWVAPLEGFRGVELVVPRADAFGSGEHGSTRAALLNLHALWDSRARSLADIGTGSGILAAYGAARGCPVVRGCDIDPVAVQRARELLPDAHMVVGGADALPGSADSVVANMTGTELTGSLDAILAGWNGSGILVLSGMRAHEVGPIVARLPALPVRTVEVDGYHSVALGPLSACQA